MVGEGELVAEKDEVGGAFGAGGETLFWVGDGGAAEGVHASDLLRVHVGG